MSTQRQALNMPLFFYIVRSYTCLWRARLFSCKAKYKRKLPVVLTCQEVVAMLAQMAGTHGLMLNYYMVLDCG